MRRQVVAGIILSAVFAALGVYFGSMKIVAIPMIAVFVLWMMMYTCVNFSMGPGNPDGVVTYVEESGVFLLTFEGAGGLVLWLLQTWLR